MPLKLLLPLPASSSSLLSSPPYHSAACCAASLSYNLIGISSARASWSSSSVSENNVISSCDVSDFLLLLILVACHINPIVTTFPLYYMCVYVWRWAGRRGGGKAGKLNNHYSLAAAQTEELNKPHRGRRGKHSRTRRASIS